ncbi:kinase-like protein, partial [Piromyces finnis]
ELDLLREATISSILIHPNILYMKYMVRTANYFYLISEKIDGEDLCDYIMKNGSLPEKKAREIIYEVIVALQYLHNNYIIHRDIKCENIMIEKGTGRIVLLDFGSACFYTNLSSQINEFCGSPVYQAPEVILSQPYWGPELDIWGLGVVLYVLTTGILPFDPSQPNMNDNNMIDLMYSKFII